MENRVILSDGEQGQRLFWESQMFTLRFSLYIMICAGLQIPGILQHTGQTSAQKIAINAFSWLHINSRLLLVFFCMMWLVHMCDTTDSHTGQTSAQKIAVNAFLGGQHIRKTHSTPGWA